MGPFSPQGPLSAGAFVWVSFNLFGRHRAAVSTLQAQEGLSTSPPGRPSLLATQVAGRKDSRPRVTSLPREQRTQTLQQCGWQSSDAGREEGETEDRAVGLVR